MSFTFSGIHHVTLNVTDLTRSGRPSQAVAAEGIRLGGPDWAAWLGGLAGRTRLGEPG